MKVLAREAETGAESLLYRFDPGWSAERLQNSAPENLLVWEGELTVGDQRLKPMTYAYRPTGYADGPCSSDTGATVVSFALAPNAPLSSKVPIPALDTEPMEWEPYSTDDGPVRYWTKMLRGDEESLDAFFLMKAHKRPDAESEPYARPETIAEHEGPEEAFFLDGKALLYDGAIDAPIWMTKGTFVHRAACSKHRTLGIFEDQLTYTHNFFSPYHEGQGAITRAVYPVETPAVRALKRGVNPGLPRRW